jgi:hypothetical protein
MRKIFYSIFILLLLSSQSSFAQPNNYWTESFESTAIPGNTAGAYSTPTNVSLASGVWNMYYTYRGSAGACDGKPLRLLNTTTAGISGASFAITPVFNSGVGQLFFVENSGSARIINIYKSTDNGATFTLQQTVTTLGAACDTTILTINNATITNLKFTNETTSNIGLDNMKVSKNGTLLDGVVIVPPPAADSTPYYPDPTGLLPAFPGAEGAGKYTRGGRGGVVVEVTNLLDDASGNTVGSFRWAQKQNVGAKTIVFKVSGTIHLVDALSFARGDVTIAGQTAPGDGICIADYPVTIGKKNIIMRHIRFRLGDIGITRTGYASSAADAVNSSGGANADSIIIDHCTASWSIDEAATFKNMTHFTMQNCMISEPLNNSDHSGELHGYGGIWGGVNATFHHNLFAHCSSRNCRFNGSRQYSAGEKDTVDYRNNVIYDWGINTVNGGEGGFYNIVNNYYKPGPGTNAAVFTRTLNPYKDATLPYGKYYMTGNVMTSSAAITENNWLGVKMEDGLTPLADTGLSKNTYQIKTYHVTTHTAEDAYTYVLKNAGATLPRRDAVDTKIMNDVINGTGGIIDCQGGFPAFTDTSLTKVAWPELASRTPAADADHDGMADEWELQRGLNPAVAADRNGISSNGYTHLENYLNGDSIVAGGIINTCIPVPAINAAGATGDWLQLKDTSYLRFISTDTTNLVASIKDNGAFGSFSASYYTVNTTRFYNGKAYLNRNVTITPATPAAITAPVTVRFYFSKAEFDALKLANPSVASLADLRILKIADNTCPSAISGTVTEIIPSSTGNFGTYANGYYVEFQTSSFSTFFLGSAAAVVPVNLVSFRAAYTGAAVKTAWVTTQEVNTRDFTVERSADANTFTRIGLLPARNLSTTQSYDLNDESPLRGISYYRLKITDLDGRISYSNVVKINISTKPVIQISPNPADDHITISHPKALSAATLIVMNASGQRIMMQNVNANAVQTNIVVTGMSAGLYIIKYISAGETANQTFIKK